MVILQRNEGRGHFAGAFGAGGKLKLELKLIVVTSSQGLHVAGGLLAPVRFHRGTPHRQ